MVAIDSPKFKELLQDAIDLIEFANGDPCTKWGAVRKAMGHEAPFNLEMLGIGNEQWQTDKYYVKPNWLYEHVDFYDHYPRKVKVFAGEYAAHPLSGMNRPDANTLGGALAEVAFLTGIERNADVVVLASYAPLFARVSYAQWSPDMIWFDGSTSYVTPGYYVQKLYAENMGDVTLNTLGQEKKLQRIKSIIV